MNNVNEWLDAFPYRDAQARVKELQAKKQEIDTELFGLQEYIALYERTHPARISTSAGPPTEEVETVRTLRVAVARVTKDSGRGLRLGQLRNALIERGWLTDTKNDYHRLQMTASNMVKAGQLKRPEPGLYVSANGAARQEAIPMR